MRVLFISNYYAPCQYAGGYAQLCQEVADGLYDRGHAVEVLTSQYGDGSQDAHRYPVHRLLRIDPDLECGKLYGWQFFVDRRPRERHDVAAVHQVVQEFGPDVIFVWHAVGLPRVVLQQIEQMPQAKVAYYLADYYPEIPDEYIVYWQSQPVHWTARLFKRPLAGLASRVLAREGKPVRLEYPNTICVSEYVRSRMVSQSLIPDDAVVIHNGVDLASFSPRKYPRDGDPGVLRCLIAGRVEPDKGIHTVIEAVALLAAREESPGIKLTILGHGPKQYLTHLRNLVATNRLEGLVAFKSTVPREQMPNVLASNDVLILASEYEEPLARAGQEAMAMGLLVIGTTTGGSGELLVHNRTGLVFEAGDAGSLAARLECALQQPSLVTQLADAGRQAVAEGFDIALTNARIERYLSALVDTQAAAQGGAKR